MIKMLIVAVVLVMVVLLVLGGMVYQSAGLHRDARRLPPTGTLVEMTGGRKMHIRVTGEGRPVVVLEAGIAASSLSWALVQDRVAEFTTVCSYDRAGLGWSDLSSAPRTPAQLAAELRSVLQAAQLAPPYVLVAHSFGAFVVQRYASLFAGEVCGIVLVDPLAATEWYPSEDSRLRMLRRGVRLSRRGALLARLGVVRASLAMLQAGGRLGPRLAGRVASGTSGSGFMDRIAGEIRKLPKDVWPAVASHWSNPKCFESMAQHLQRLPESAAEIAALNPMDLPAVVLVAKDARSLNPAPALANADIIRADDCGHWIQLDDPRLVIDAIRSLVDRCQS